MTIIINDSLDRVIVLNDVKSFTHNFLHKRYFFFTESFCIFDILISNVKSIEVKND